MTSGNAIFNIIIYRICLLLLNTYLQSLTFICVETVLPMRHTTWPGISPNGRRFSMLHRLHCLSRQVAPYANNFPIVILLKGKQRTYDFGIESPSFDFLPSVARIQSLTRLSLNIMIPCGNFVHTCFTSRDSFR